MKAIVEDKKMRVKQKQGDHKGLPYILQVPTCRGDPCGLPVPPDLPAKQYGRIVLEKYEVRAEEHVQ
ncbi:MAG: hypothetical protein NVSMB38_05440 [Ktedonobacteraceae bacterium]